ncbi:MAG: hypothetical protein IKG18_05570 [Atopobiaceae bacterium]|nr:hypothetical protein [Atopobiaceae bacterium]
MTQDNIRVNTESPNVCSDENLDAIVGGYVVYHDGDEYFAIDDPDRGAIEPLELSDIDKAKLAAMRIPRKRSRQVA